MRRLPSRPSIDDKTHKKLEDLAEQINQASDPKSKADDLWDSRRSTDWFKDGVIQKLKSIAGKGNPCMYCDAGEASDVEHYYPKSKYPNKTFLWVNYLWICSICNRYKSNQFPTNPNEKILNPLDENVWEYISINKKGQYTGTYDLEEHQLNSRGESTISIVELNREGLVERRYEKINQLIDNLEGIIERINNGSLTQEQAQERLEKWSQTAIQPDVAQYFLKGPGKDKEPFKSLLAEVL